MIVREHDVLDMVGTARRILLVEPKYPRKYPPLGLAKISAYAKRHGADCIYSRQCQGGDWDLVCVTTLFTYDSSRVYDAIDEARFLLPNTPILVGGVFASLMPEAINWDGVSVFAGCSSVLDAEPPDRTIDWGAQRPWDAFSFVFTSRGCPNKCPYCAVWRMEGTQSIISAWRDHIDPTLPNVMISDNNLSACPLQHIEDVCTFLYDHNKRVVFDNGFDCKHITQEMAQLLGRLKFTRHGLRLAFDRIEEDGVFQNAVELLKQHGAPKSQVMAYVLFNFNDTPQEANYRMSECVRLGIRPYPQQYVPLKRLGRKPVFVGRHWTPMLLRAFRFFWLMAGYYTKGTFEQWVRTQTKYTLIQKDWEAWHGA